MQITAIKFNYSSSPGVVNALAIRQNFTTALTAPEWVPGKLQPKESLAAYTIASVAGNTITIQASFTAAPGEPASMQIRADGGGVLGAIDPTTINVSGGISTTEFVTLNLAHHQIGSTGILREDIQWDWSYQSADGTWVSMGSSFHRIYVVLSTPSLPWLQQAATPTLLTQLPWADALDYACVWAKGTSNPLDATTAVTQAVNGNLGLTYDITHGASTYTQSIGANRTSWFLCTAFLAFLNRQPESKGNIVNCTDCATITSTFANLLGCDLSAAVMASPGGFLCNKIIAIGGGIVWNYPFPPANRFSYHEVAWTGTCSYSDRIYDACLLADSSGDPWDWTDPTLLHTPELPTNEIFTGQVAVPNLPIPSPLNLPGYRERLAQNSSGGIGRCKPQGPWPNASNGRRGVI